MTIDIVRVFAPAVVGSVREYAKRHVTEATVNDALMRNGMQIIQGRDFWKCSANDFDSVGSLTITIARGVL